MENNTETIALAEKHKEEGNNAFKGTFKHLDHVFEKK